MIRGDRVRQLRESLSLTKQELADMMGVSVATINNWENWKSNPTSSNLSFLAITLNTTEDYLQGLTDTLTSDSISTKAEETTQNITTIPDDISDTKVCIPKLTWPENLLNSPELSSRRKRSHSTRLLSLDRDKGEAVFQASTSRNGDIYITTPKNCTCRDFTVNKGKIPCKHIFRLLEELGLFTSEYFKPDDDDYTMHVAFDATEHGEIDETQDEAYHQEQENISEVPQIDNEKVHEISPALSIFFKILKFVCSSFSCLIALLFILGALTQGREWLCFPAGFIFAGFLTSTTAKRNKLEGSIFNWGLYGTLVPVVSWIDVVMTGSQSKTKGFLKGIAYSIVGIIVFLLIFAQFLPPVSAH